MLDQYIDLLDKAKEILNETLGGYNELDTSEINELKNKVNRLESIIDNYKNNEISGVSIESLNQEVSSLNSLIARLNLVKLNDSKCTGLFLNLNIQFEKMKNEINDLIDWYTSDHYAPEVDFVKKFQTFLDIEGLNDYIKGDPDKYFSEEELKFFTYMVFINLKGVKGASRRIKMAEETLMNVLEGFMFTADYDNLKPNNNRIDIYDCSGLVQYILMLAGIPTPANSTGGFINWFKANDEALHPIYNINGKRVEGDGYLIKEGDILIATGTKDAHIAIVDEVIKDENNNIIGYKIMEEAADKGWVYTELNADFGYKEDGRPSPNVWQKQRCNVFDTDNIDTFEFQIQKDGKIEQHSPNIFNDEGNIEKIDNNTAKNKYNSINNE